jgi:5-methylcytosine-specific restriction endonuclease McrA
MAIVYRDGIAGKICANPECQEWKPVSEFHQARLLGIPRGDGYKSRCKECLNAGKREKRFSDPEKYREQARAYVAENQEHIREIKRKHQETNPERYAEALYKYREGHRDEINASARERRQENLEALKAFYNYTCLCCGKREPEIELTRDHIVPLEKNGNDWISNIQPLCARCNSKKSNRCVDYRTIQFKP